MSETRSAEKDGRCPGYHNGFASPRSTESDTCIICGGYKPPLEVSVCCTCEPIAWEDGSVSHEDHCAIYPWCPHEMGAYTCGVPCDCRCDGCLRLTLAHRVMPPEATAPADPSEEGR